MSKKNGTKKSRSEKVTAKILLATAIIELLSNLIELILKAFD